MRTHFTAQDTPGADLAAPGDHLAAPGDHLAAPGDHLATPGDHLAAPGDHLAAPGDHLDAFELRDAVLGDGVVLHEIDEGGFVIHIVTAGQVQRLGAFIDAAAAWRALDDIDRHPDEWNLATSEADTEAGVAAGLSAPR